jgi:hypothetical protein
LESYGIYFTWALGGSPIILGFYNQLLIKKHKNGLAAVKEKWGELFLL